VTPITVIVAAYNEERHVAECLASLLAQTYSPIEIIVADDGSTDGTAAVVQTFAGVRLLRRPHEGKARAVNAAAEAATGDILLFLDADLRFERNYVAMLIAPILAGRAVGTCHADERVANPDNVWSHCQQVLHGLPRDRRLDLAPEDFAAGTTVFRAIRRRAFLDAGGFDDTGFLDDQSLAPKLRARAAYVSGATCFHHNPDRLHEVFAAGVWGGKSSYHLHGVRALGRNLPLFALFAGATAAVRRQMPALLPYAVAYRSGVFWGIFKRASGIDRTMGR
jgi:cellulose synthase/poly-beta-1,6-N-acetylglucosamine synthase-like glycosyltransferase